MKSQTSDTEQNNLVFNSANFLLMRFINFGTIPEGYNDSISLQSNSIFQVNLNMMYNHAPESFVPDYMLLLTQFAHAPSHHCMFSYSPRIRFLVSRSHQNLLLTSPSSNLSILVIHLVHQAFTSLEDLSRSQDKLHYEWCIQLESQGQTAWPVDNISKNIHAFFLHTHTHTQFQNA